MSNVIGGGVRGSGTRKQPAAAGVGRRGGRGSEPSSRVMRYLGQHHKDLLGALQAVVEGSMPETQPAEA